MKSKTAVVLHNIRSAYNVGSIFRTADGAGVAEVVLVGYTPLPVDYFGKVNMDIAKTALGAEQSMPWRTYRTMGAAITALRREGYALVAVEQDACAKSLSKLRMRGPKAFILGNEVRGLSKSVKDSADVIVAIPMHGRKESLNVSVAAGIVLYHGRV